ncbi:MAG: FAD-binding protein, partial [Planctomycetales bacterium]|nr:FAD-binding protein [Planctomycetales bacterium]
MTLVSGFEKIVRRQEPLAERTWLHLGGPAQFYAEPNSVDELAALVRRCANEQVPIRMLGGGSNVLVRDEGVTGMVVSLSSPAFSRLQISGGVVTAGGGVKLAHAISETVRAGLAGLEPLVGIPGTIGGALHGNSGSRGGDIGQWACRATVMTRAGEIIQRDREDLVFAYRQSSLDELVILNAEFRLEPDDPVQLTKRMQKQ